MPLATPPPPSGPIGLTPLMSWYSSSRNDHFVTTTTCAECDGLYDLQGVIGWVYASNDSSVPGLIPLMTYYSGANSDNILTTAPPTDPSYGFVRIEGWALPPGATPANGTAMVQTVNGVHHWAVAGSWIANATAAGFTVQGPLATIWTYGPPPPTTQTWYEGIFLRLQRLLGPLLDYYWVRPRGGEGRFASPHTPLLCPCAVVDPGGVGVVPGEHHQPAGAGRRAGRDRHAGGARRCGGESPRSAFTRCRVAATSPPPPCAGHLQAGHVRLGRGPPGRAVVL
jgi:hypothetical protein